MLYYAGMSVCVCVLGRKKMKERPPPVFFPSIRHAHLFLLLLSTRRKRKESSSRVYRRVEGIHRCRFLFQKTGQREEESLQTIRSSSIVPHRVPRGNNTHRKMESRRVVEFLKLFFNFFGWCRCCTVPVVMRLQRP